MKRIIGILTFVFAGIFFSNEADAQVIVKRKVIRQNRPPVAVYVNPPRGNAYGYRRNINRRYYSNRYYNNRNGRYYDRPFNNRRVERTVIYR